MSVDREDKFTIPLDLVAINGKFKDGFTLTEDEERNLPRNYRPASEDDVPEGRNCGNCGYYGNGYCDFWDAEVRPNYYCNKWMGDDEDLDEMDDDDEMEDDYDDDIEEDRAVPLEAPVYMRNAARRGLKMHEEGHSGDGLVPQTVEDARKMARGEVTEAKWRKIGPWIARHMVDLDAPKNKNPNDPGYPGAGLVAHLLWGSGPSKANAQRAMDYANGVVERMEESRAASQPAPKKDQIKGSNKNPKGSAKDKSGSISLDASTEKALGTKVSEHNKAMDEADKPNWTKVSLGALKSVWRRGAGAYSTSHRPGVSRSAWAMARVNAFIFLSKNGRPQNPKYVTDNDLLREGHPKKSSAK
jgi:hypothetical protein